jgi:2-polyprenyl-3-methyl-5-hydroxy-6-metoxy-1,4-benzoquinol methylase
MDIQDLETFLDRFRQESIVRRIAKRSNLSEKDVQERLAAYTNEVLVGLDLIKDDLTAGMRVLEVGAGLCMLSLYLRYKGVDVVALEPTGIGYGFWNAAQSEIISAVPEVTLPLWTHGAEDLDPDRHGVFDLIFSVHVFEHMADLAGALRGMASVLAPKGLMAHLSPNYTVPYEPHFGRPLLPGAPHLSRSLMGSLDRQPGIWESLNFITSKQVVRLAQANSLTVQFKKGLLAEALQRLHKDPEFARRHSSSLVKFIVGLSRLPGFEQIAKRLPVQISTPMQFKLKRP